jgi:TPR repeat protein
MTLKHSITQALYAVEEGRWQEARDRCARVLEQDAHFVPALLLMRGLRVGCPQAMRASDVGLDETTDRISEAGVERRMAADSYCNSLGLHDPDEGEEEQQCRPALAWFCGYFHYNVMRAPARAVKQYRVAAALGFAPAQNGLGLCLQSGEGITRDLMQAVVLYRQAAAQGFPAAQCNLGYTH